MAIANLQAQMANLTSQLSQYIERTTMQRAPTFDASYRQGYQANQRGWESVNTWGIKAIINQGTTCFPTPTIQIGAIIQILCGGNLNKLNKKDIGSHMRSSILALCSHHSLPHNNSNQTQVRQWLMIKFLMY